jgi:cyclopropane fatty-acyl-phospholipid synthase-like methyltransferase
MSGMTENSEATKVAKTYYDGASTNSLYKAIWGGENIHYGIYAHPDESIHNASERTVQVIAQTLETLNQESRVLDLGAGYGGAARYLAKTYGCNVCCLNLSELQNERNQQLNQKQNLSHLIEY